MYEDVDSGGIIEKGRFKENKEGFVVVRDTATGMVCIRLVSLNDALHLWPFLKITSTSFSSAFTSLSIVIADHCLVSRELVSPGKPGFKIERGTECQIGGC